MLGSRAWCVDADPAAVLSGFLFGLSGVATTGRATFGCEGWSTRRVINSAAAQDLSARWKGRTDPPVAVELNRRASPTHRGSSAVPRSWALPAPPDLYAPCARLAPQWTDGLRHPPSARVGASRALAAAPPCADTAAHDVSRDSRCLRRPPPCVDMLRRFHAAALAARRGCCDGKSKKKLSQVEEWMRQYQERLLPVTGRCR